MAWCQRSAKRWLEPMLTEFTDVYIYIHMALGEDELTDVAQGDVVAVMNV